MTRLLVIAAAVACMTACESRKPEPGGFGPWSFSRSKRGDVKTGRCDPHVAVDGRAMTWCYAGTAYQIAGRPAELDLYFLGSEPDAPLVEIQMKIRGCKEQALDQWMRATYGKPVETRGAVTYFQNSFLWAAALIPSQPGRCTVHFLPLSEQSEIGRVKQRTAGGSAASSEPGSATAGSGS